MRERDQRSIGRERPVPSAGCCIQHACATNYPRGPEPRVGRIRRGVGNAQGGAARNDTYHHIPDARATVRLVRMRDRRLP